MGSAFNNCMNFIRSRRRRGGLFILGGVVVVILFVPLQFWMALLGAILIALGLFLWFAV